tara:strand:- start:67 stop:1062 length:996 start_codon:yes stop_codon:yes gene_type:complete
MENVVMNNYSDDESSSEGSEGSEELYELYSGNIGCVYKNKINDTRRLLDETLETDYNDLRNEYFTPKLTKKRLLIDTSSLVHTNSTDTNNYIINFKNTSSLDNTKNGYDYYRNVIGFKLIKAIIYNTLYTIDNNNNTLIIDIDGTNITVSFDVGSYTVDELGTHIQNTLNSSASGTWTLSYNPRIHKYSIKNDTNKYKLLWVTSNSQVYRLLGARAIDDTSFKQSSVSYEFDNIPHHNNMYLDLVIDEIPMSACKDNPFGFNVIDRIPLNGDAGNLVYYEPRTDNYNLYFNPIALSKLTIKLYDGLGNIHHNENINNSFEFELTILNQSLI